MKLSREPQNLTEDSWYYEMKHGIEIVHWETNSNNLRVAYHIKIPWKKLLVSVRRYKQKKKVAKP